MKTKPYNSSPRHFLHPILSNFRYLLIFSILLCTSYISAQVTPGDPKAVPIEFMFYHKLEPSDSGVGINGTMNDWKVIYKMKQVEPEFWKATLELQPNSYDYKFVTYKDTASQSGVTGYFTDPLNYLKGGPFNNSIMKVKSPFIYYFFPFLGSSTTNTKPKIGAKIAVSNSATLDLSRLVFILDGNAVANAKSYYDASTRTFTYTPTSDLDSRSHTAILKAYTTEGDSAEGNTTFTIERTFIIAPYTFQFDSKSPNFNFLSKVEKVGVKGTFNSEGLNSMADTDSDGVYTYTANLRIGKPEEYTYIINGGSYINDPDNPNLSSTHRTQAVKIRDTRSRFGNFSPATGSIYTSPKTTLDVKAHVFPADSAVLFSISSLSANLDGKTVAVSNSNYNGYELDAKVSLSNLTEGRHVLEFFGRDIYSAASWPASCVFGIYPEGSGYHYVDGENDDKGTGSYKYPASVAAGSADIREVNIRVNPALDSLSFTIGMEKISDNTRLGFEIVSKLDACYAEAPQHAGIKIPEWNNRGVFLTLSSPASAYIDTASENVIFISRDPIVRGIKIKLDPAAIAKNEFHFSIPLSQLESVMGSYKDAWYYGVYSYLKDQTGTVAAGSTLGGQDIPENPNVYDAAFFNDNQIQQRLLSNFNSEQNIGGTRLAVIGSNERGFMAIRPSDINSQLGQLPEIRLYAGGGNLYNDSVKVAGFVDLAPGSTVTLKVGSYEFTAATDNNKEFFFNVILSEGRNEITAGADYNNRKITSSPVVYNYVVDHSPKVKISANVSQSLVTLTAVSPDDADNTGLTYLWEQDAANPQQINTLEKTNKSIAISKTQVNGDYYFTVTAKNALQKTGWARAVITVSDSGISIPDYTKWHPAWVDSAVVYSIFPRTFSQEGNLKSVTARMKEIKTLGINCIWFLPLHPTTGNLGPDNPGYAITDYLNILEQYGTKEDFKTLVETAHQNGIKVIMDLVIQHTSDLHPFMRDAIKYKQNSPYYPFYMWDNSGNFQYMFTWVDLPSINYEAQSTRDYLINMVKYWQQNFNIDGYRCDVAWGINDLRPSGPAFWQRMRSELKSLKPDIFLLGEADALLANNTYFDKKFDAAYDYSWFNGIKNYLSNTGTLSNLNSVINSYLSSPFPGDARPFRFLENQDEQRFIEAFGQAKTKTAAALLLTLPGVPMLYAGQEVGEVTNRGNINWEDPQGLRAYYSRLIHIRKENPALLDGSFTSIVNSTPEQVYSYLRTKDKNNAIVNINFSDAPLTVNFSVPMNDISFDSTASFYLNDELNRVSYKVKGTDLKNYQVLIPANTAQVLVLSDNQLTNAESQKHTIPASYEISQNYPNPFNPSTSIRYQIPEASHVVISIYNVLGQKVTELVNMAQNPGYYQAVWNASNSASGVYIYSVEIKPVSGGNAGIRTVKKMMLVK